MTTKETEHYYEFSSSDENGEFLFRICHQGMRQLQVKSGHSEVFINIDLKELKAIRDLINKVIALKK